MQQQVREKPTTEGSSTCKCQQSRFSKQIRRGIMEGHHFNANKRNSLYKHFANALELSLIRIFWKKKKRKSRFWLEGILKSERCWIINEPNWSFSFSFLIQEIFRVAVWRIFLFFQSPALGIHKYTWKHYLRYHPIKWSRSLRRLN